MTEEKTNAVVTDTAQKGFNRFNKNGKAKTPRVFRGPKVYKEIFLLIKNNSEIKRFTSIGILNYLLQKGEISGTGRYVYYTEKMFVVKYNGIERGYPYTEQFFINALVAAFTSFSASAQLIINEFTSNALNKGLNEVATQEGVEDMVQAAIAHGAINVPQEGGDDNNTASAEATDNEQ